MKTWRIVLAALIALCLGMIAHLNKAHADSPPCVPLQPLLDALVKRYGETIAMTGKMGVNQVIVTRSEKGTFSIIVSDGKAACIVLAGDKAELDKGI